MTIKTTGRTDLDDFFKLSGVLTYKRLNKTPFLAFIELEGETVVQVVDSAKKLMVLADDVPVMCQWEGQWNSDFFQMTVRDVRKAMVGRGLWP